jgi:ankyrin repeat protein
MNPLNQARETPLFMAAQIGHIEIVKFLIDEVRLPIHKLRPLARGLPIHAACEGGHNDIVTYLIEKGSSLEHVDQGGRSPIVLAAMTGSLATVNILIAHQVKLNLPGRQFTPMISAAAFGHLDILDRLVRANASLNLPNCNGVTPIEAAVNHSHERIVRYLIAQGARVEPEVIGLASAIGDLAVLKTLLEGTTIDPSEHRSGQTWLQQALDAKEVATVDYLLERGVSVVGCTFKECYCKQKIVKCLLKRCPFLKERMDGMELLTVTAWKCHNASAIRFLIECGVLFDRTVLAEYADLLTTTITDPGLGHLTELLLSFTPDLSGRTDIAENWGLRLARRQFSRCDDVIGSTRKLIECGVAVSDRARPQTEEERALEEALLTEAQRFQDGIRFRRRSP